MFRLSTVSIAVVSSLYIASAQAIPANTLPTGGQVAQGQANIQQSANQIQINQNSQKAVINWNTFNIGKDAGVQFQQPNAQSSTLNRVANGSSEIAGQLKANGQVYLLNPNGVLFSPTAQVNTGSLVVATGHISDEDYLNGQGTLQNNATGKIINQGNLTAAQGGQIVLISQQIENTGTITVEQGQVQLLAGQSVRVNVTADGLIKTELGSSGAGNGKISNSGQVSATGGQVNVLASGQNSRIQHTGVIEAQSILEKDGKIYLIAGYEGDGVAPKTGTAVIDGVLDASAPNVGNGGFIETSAGQVSITDNAKVTTKAAQGKTGTWLIDPQDFTIAASGDITGTALSNNLTDNNVEILSSSGGTEGEGNIYVNDEVTYSTNQLTLTASKDVVLNEGINVLGSGTLAVNTATANGADASDPTGRTRGETGNGYVYFESAGDGLLTINGEAYRVIKNLGDATSSTNADLQGIQSGSGINYALGGDIDASSTATWNGGQGFNPVNLNGQKFNGLGNEISNLTINRPMQDDVGLFGDIENAEISHLTLNNFNITGRVDTGALLGRSEFGINIIRDVRVNGGEVIGTELGTGGLAGLTNAMITNSHANNVTVEGIEEVGGLIGFLDIDSSLVNSSAASTVRGTRKVGGLVGYSEGTATIFNSYATGDVIGITSNNSRIGGLVGDNEGTIRQSHATGIVTGDDGVGGLVGDNYGTIEQSHATGQVIGTRTTTGGLSGLNRGTITASFAEGDVTGVEGVGGLVGTNEQGGSIINSHAIGQVSATGSYVGGLVGSSTTTNVDTGVSANVSVTNSYATGNVSGLSSVGGLVGTNRATNGSTALIDQSYATGDVTQVGATSIGEGEIGGLVGINYAVGTGSMARIQNSHATGNVQADAIWSYLVGGLVGGNGSADFVGITEIINSYAEGDITGNNLVGGLIGGNTGLIQDSHAIGKVTGIDDIGGLIGGTVGGIISNSYATGEVEATGSKVGGLIGFSNTIYNDPIDGLLIAPVAPVIQESSYATGNVSGSSNVGGLVGLNENGLVQDSYATGDVTGVVTGSLTGDFDISDSIGGLVGENDGTIQQSHATGKVTGRSDTGGLVGANTANGIIEQSYATGNVEGLVFAENTDGNAGATGGLVGFNDGRITTSYATGEVTGWRGVGGLAGSSAADNSADSSALAVIENSYATGNVSGELGIGGLVGYLHASNGAVATIDQVYATGAVTASNGQVGGLVGINEEGSVSNAYWDTQTTGQSNAIGENTGTINNVTGISTAQMQQLASFSNWGTDISANGGENTVWRIYEGQTAPLLRSFLKGATLTVNADLQKVYDGTTDAATGSHTLVNAEDVVINQTAPDVLGTVNYVYADKNVGTHAVIENGLYSHQQGYDIQVVGGQGTITPRQLGGGVDVADYQRVYDGTTNISSNFYLNNMVMGDDVNIDGFLAFSDKNVGAAKGLQTAYDISGNDIANYDLSLVNATIADTIQVVQASNEITPATINTVTGITANSRVYNGTTDASLNTGSAQFTGLITGDDLAVNNAIGQFSDKNVANAKIVNISGISLTGADAGNYVLGNSTATTTANITPATITDVTGISANDRVYDATTNSTLNTGSAQFTGLITGDNLTVATATGQFEDKNAGNTKIVNIFDITLTGTDVGNYVLGNDTATTTANITPRNLNVTASVLDRTYDASTAATVNFDYTPITGDNVNVSGNGSYADANAGINKTVTLSGVSLTGADAINYTVSAPTTAQGTINRAQIQVIGVKDHDGTALFTGDQLRLRGVQLSTGEYERIAASGTATAVSSGPSVHKVQNGVDYYGIIDFADVSQLQLLDGNSLTLPTGYVSGLASNYQIQNSPQHYAYIYPVQSVHEDTPDNGKIIQKPEIIQPVIDPVVFEDNFIVNRLDDCQSRDIGDQEIPNHCILTPKIDIQVQDATDDDGREATPIKTKHALIIANSNYQPQIGKLTGVKNDSQVVQRSLTEQGYQVTVVNDADRAAMITAFNTLIKDSEMDDSVVIYYAGHGYVHNNSSVGYWLPVDATYSNQKDWISNVDISRFVRNMAAKQILLVSDSCFSGSLSYEAALQQKGELDKNAVLKRRSVLVMTSGSEEPVADQGANGLSPFAAAFVQGINQVPQGQDLRGQNLYKTVYQQVTSQYKQYPSYGGLPSAGHNTGGEYIFEKN